jgi:hypothetical protein
MPLITESAELAWEEKPTQREGRIQRKHLAKGREGAPDNFEFNLYRHIAGYGTPRHRHNWEQMRFGLNSTMTYDPGKSISTGSLVYFPEGAYYGPQETPETSEVLLLQYGGASGQGYLSQEQLFVAREALLKKGELKGGIYTWTDASGKKHNQDGAEAIWEEVFQRKIQYIKPRIPEPVKLETDAFHWVDSDTPGLEEKFLAMFTERKVKAMMVRATQAATLPVSANERNLFFTLKGNFSLAGRQCGTHTSLYSDRGEALTLALEPGWEALMITLPQISEHSRA